MFVEPVRFDPTPYKTGILVPSADRKPLLCGLGKPEGRYPPARAGSKQPATAKWGFYMPWGKWIKEFGFYEG